METFPLNAGISEMRAIMKIIKENNNSVELSKLAREAKEDIDDLFPLLDACKELGLCMLKQGRVKLTEAGSKLTMGNMSETFGRALVSIEPFKSTISLLKTHGSMDTRRLTLLLRQKGVYLYTDERTNVVLLRDLLLKWGVRSKILGYEQKSDRWFART